MTREHMWMAIIGGVLFGAVMGWLASVLFDSVWVGVGLGIVAFLVGIGYYASNLEKHGTMNAPKKRGGWFVWFGGGCF